MPTYQNTTNQDLIGSDPIYSVTFPANSTVEVPKYVHGLPPGVNLISPLPRLQPFVILADINTLPNVTDIRVDDWDGIVIYNGTNEAISISVNDDDTNPMVVPAGSKEMWDNSTRLFGTIKVLTTTPPTGDFYIWGCINHEMIHQY